MSADLLTQPADERVLPRIDAKATPQTRRGRGDSGPSIEQSLGDSRSGADSARKFLDEQIKDYDQKLRMAEERVNAFRLKYMGLFPTTGKDFVSSMGTVSEQIKEIRLELRVAEQTRD